MGTLAEIQVYDTDADLAERAMADALDDMQRADRLLSNYDQRSELSAMNREAARGPFHVSDQLYEFVKRCQDYFRETSGTFDPTVGPLVRAWGFFSAQPAKPTPDVITAAKARTGFAKVRLDDVSRTVAYGVAGMEIDPGGIGKGLAVDDAVRSLRRSGITSALVSAGGSTLFALGHPPDRGGWNVAINNPADVGQPFGYVSLRDNALSTSGVSRQSVTLGSHRYSHIFDPRTGEPIEGMCQVTVIATSAIDSDALTKAAFALARTSVVRLFQRRPGRHVLRVEGACSGRHQIWMTPWSSSEFDLAGESR